MRIEVFTTFQSDEEGVFLFLFLFLFLLLLLLLLVPRRLAWFLLCALS